MIDIFRSRDTMPMIFQNEMAECGIACLAMIAIMVSFQIYVPCEKASACQPVAHL